ncbi:hypothetical protein [Actinokineospora diospyrosa]|uniref:hypothetical protein n=1 Tax=Actinokineospora diospyrosa TaxID=103728 RepID=UPI0020A4A282|nr:hypothetical protein [Actinokineospora diospyrosa]
MRRQGLEQIIDINPPGRVESDADTAGIVPENFRKPLGEANYHLVFHVAVVDHAPLTPHTPFVFGIATFGVPGLVHGMRLVQPGYGRCRE